MPGNGTSRHSSSTADWRGPFPTTVLFMNYTTDLNHTEGKRRANTSSVAEMLSHNLKQWLSTWGEGRGNPEELRCMWCTWMTGGWEGKIRIHPFPDLISGLAVEARASCWRSLPTWGLLKASSFFPSFPHPLLHLGLPSLAASWGSATPLLLLCHITALHHPVGSQSSQKPTTSVSFFILLTCFMWHCSFCGLLSYMHVHTHCSKSNVSYLFPWKL